MPKIQLTIKTSYLPKWGAYEGIRELVQNGRDAEVEHSAPLKVEWYKGTDVGQLRIENEGTTLPIKSLLLGHTTKIGRSDMIGKFGEGLKLGVLALVRAGHPVKIRNGSEVWIPSLERSDLFGEDVLTFQIEKGREEKNRVRIEVGGVTREAWDAMKPCFLFLQKPKEQEEIKTCDGTLLLGPTFKGRVYVKGIFVQTDPDLMYGYDLTDAELDRDRRMVESWNLRYKTKNILMNALNKREELFSDFSDLLENPTTETESIVDQHSTYALPEKAVDAVVARFKQKHGEDAVPVQSLSESQDVEHLGKKGVVVTKQLGAVLAKKLGDAMTVKEALRKEVLHRYGWSDLSEVEKAILSDAVALINAVEPFGIATVEVVDFRSEDLMGQFKDGRTFIAKKYLSDQDETLRILVHEVAHRQGGDGAKSHIDRVEFLWMNIVRNMRKFHAN